MRRARGSRLAVVALAVALAGASAAAQDTPDIVVVDQERLFQDSAMGRRIADDLEARSSELAAENRAIEAELVAEERALTERRSELAPDEFRALADAFDDKVERLRGAQDAKTRDLVARRDAERESFTRAVGPILLDFMRRTGASVMLDRRSVVATSDRADVTDELIAEINARVDAGAPSDAAGDPAADTGDGDPTDADDPREPVPQAPAPDPPMLGPIGD